MKTLFTTAIAGEHYKLTPEQHAWAQSQTKRKLQLCCVVQRSFVLGMKPTRKFSVELHEVDGVIEPRLVLGPVEDGDLWIHIGFESAINGQPELLTCKMSFEKFCELNEATIMRLKAENPDAYVTHKGEPIERKPRKHAERDTILDSILNLL